MAFTGCHDLGLNRLPPDGRARLAVVARSFSGFFQRPTTKESYNNKIRANYLFMISAFREVLQNVLVSLCRAQSLD